MIPLTNIHPLTDFRHNTKKFVEELQATPAPIVLTINGKAAIVALNIAAFEAYQHRIRALEEEVQALKLKALQQAVTLGVEQAEQGQFCQRSFDEIIAAAHAAVTKDPLI